MSSNRSASAATAEVGRKWSTDSQGEEEGSPLNGGFSSVELFFWIRVIYQKESERVT